MSIVIDIDKIEAKEQRRAKIRKKSREDFINVTAPLKYMYGFGVLSVDFPHPKSGASS